MAKIVEGFPANRVQRSKYPFPEWFDGQVRVLTEDEDFKVPVNSFRGAMYAAAKRAGIKTRMAVGETKGGKKTVTIQALNPEAITSRTEAPKHAEVADPSNMEEIIQAAVQAAIASVVGQQAVKA